MTELHNCKSIIYVYMDEVIELHCQAVTTSPIIYFLRCVATLPCEI